MKPEICYPPVKQPTSTYPPVKYVDPQAANYSHQRTAVPPANPNVRYVKYVPVGYADTHSKTVGYVLWMVGFTGAHRFYYGKPLTGLLWLLTFGLLGIGWLVDLFLIPSMDREADQRFAAGEIDYNLTWVLFLLLGVLGIHRIYQTKIFTGLIYFFTGGLLGIGLIYDAFTLNDQVSQSNQKSQAMIY